MATAGMGTATIDFGAWPGSNEASAVIVGVAGIADGAAVEAWPMAEASGSHTASDAAWAARFYSLVCGDVAAGQGFTMFMVGTATASQVINFVWQPVYGWE